MNDPLCNRRNCVEAERGGGPFDTRIQTRVRVYNERVVRFTRHFASHLDEKFISCPMLGRHGEKNFIFSRCNTRVLTVNSLIGAIRSLYRGRALQFVDSNRIIEIYRGTY